MTGPTPPNGSGSNNNYPDPDDPLSLQPNDISSITIINFKLTGTIDYQTWATATERALTIRNKTGFINGKIVRPTDSENKVVKWDRANAVVISWLLASMTESISSAYVLSQNANTLWTELKQTYEKINGSVIFNTYQKINMHSQGSDSVSDYFNSLNGLWKEFDALTKLSECTCDTSNARQSFTNQLKLMQFLMRLNDSFSQIRSNILMQDPLPSVQTAFSIMSREESHKGNSISGTASKMQSSVFASKAPDFKKKNFKGTGNSVVVCKHCNIKGHSMDRCYKLIGFPKDYKFKNGNSFQRNENSFQNKTSANNSFGEVNDNYENKGQMQFSQDQMAKILSLINDKHHLEDMSANMAGTLGHTNMAVFSNKSSCHRRWIVDSGATQHMTSNTDDLQNVVDVSDLQMHVDHPNGSKAMVSEIGNLQISPSVLLADVLVVPDFKVNLLSVHKLSRDSRLGVFFNEKQCFLCNLQDSQINPIIQTGKESGGLYYLENNGGKLS